MHPHLQRAVGELAVSLRSRDGSTVLAGLRQSGCLNARFPRAEDGWAQVVSVNTSGGIAGGDRLSGLFQVQHGARATFAGQAAERIYRCLPGGRPAHVRTRIVVAGCRGVAAAGDDPVRPLRRWIGAWTSSWPTVRACWPSRCSVFGRAAMGETVEHAFAA